MPMPVCEVYYVKSKHRCPNEKIILIKYYHFTQQRCSIVLIANYCFAVYIKHVNIILIKLTQFVVSKKETCSCDDGVANF